MSKRGKGGSRQQKADKRWDKVRRNEDVGYGDDFLTNEEEIIRAEGDEDDEIEVVKFNPDMKLYMWEFGQNDPKRDSGSKLCRLGYAKKLKIGQNYRGIVLSSEANQFMSPEDLEIVERYGISGINCSWNRLGEIPFQQLGKHRCQRKLPLIFAANTVNYGKAYKMNTAEALAAALYIVGLKDEAMQLMYPFSYGQEFLRINFDPLESYSACKTETEVSQLTIEYERLREEYQVEKECKKELRKAQRNESNIGGYIQEMDLPPAVEDEGEEEGEEEEEEEGEEEEEEEEEEEGKGGNVSLIEKGGAIEKIEDEETVFMKMSASTATAEQQLGENGAVDTTDTFSTCQEVDDSSCSQPTTSTSVV